MTAKGPRTADVDGLLLVDKPAGITSHDVVAIVRRATRTRRVGHTGTLDPFATGLLVVLLGRGTRLIPYMDGEPKVYDATIRFGAETDTDDATGTITRTADGPTDEAIAEGIARLTGEIDQLPPAYSAKKVGGVRAYAAARIGEPLELTPARVTVHEWGLVGRAAMDLSVTITCSGGTYVRALARDLGRIANSAAHLSALRRTSAGPFFVRNAVTVERLREPGLATLPLRDAVPSMPAHRIGADDAAGVAHGRSIVVPADLDVAEGGRLALLDDDGTFIAVAVRTGDSLRPTLVFHHGG